MDGIFATGEGPQEATGEFVAAKSSVLILQQLLANDTLQADGSDVALKALAAQLDTKLEAKAAEQAEHSRAQEAAEQAEQARVQEESRAQNFGLQRRELQSARQRYENKLQEVETLAAQVAQLECSLGWRRRSLDQALQDKAEYSSKIRELTTKLNQCISQREHPDESEGDESESEDDPNCFADRRSNKEGFEAFQARVQNIFEQRASGSSKQLDMEDAASLAQSFAELVGHYSENSGVKQPEGLDMGILPYSIATFQGSGSSSRRTQELPPEDNRFEDKLHISYK